MPQIFKLKLCIIGEHAVGKTSLIKNFVEGAFSRDYRPTIGSNLFVKKIAFTSGGEDYEATITAWDIAGQERWQAMRYAYYKGSQGIFVVGDLSRKNTFEQIKNFWVEDVRKHVEESVPLVLLANKNDLKGEVDEDSIRALAEELGFVKVIFTSAKTGYHVMEAFTTMIKKCVNVEDLVPISLF